MEIRSFTFTHRASASAFLSTHTPTLVWSIRGKQRRKHFQSRRKSCLKSQWLFIDSAFHKQHKVSFRKTLARRVMQLFMLEHSNFLPKLENFYPRQIQEVLSKRNSNNGGKALVRFSIIYGPGKPVGDISPKFSAHNLTWNLSRKMKRERLKETGRTKLCNKFHIVLLCEKDLECMNTWPLLKGWSVIWGRK